MDWSNGTVNQKALDEWIDSYAAQAKAAGLKQVTLSFGQVCDLAKIMAGKYGECSPEDALKMLSENTSGKTVGGKNILEYIAQRLNSDGMRVSLSFGGAVANSKDWDFGFSSTNTPEKLGEQLAKWAHDAGFSGIDFDMESGAETIVQVNGASNLAKFFSSLHQAASKEGINVSLTVMGNSSQWGPTGSFLGPIFAQGTSFTQMFDGLNLMLYNGQYYLNAGQQPLQDWDLTKWIDQMMKNTGLSAAEVASYLHIGFDGAVDYTKASSSGGPLPYSDMPPGLKNGQAGAFIFAKIQAELQKHYKDPNLTLGSSFFWDDKADYSVSSGNDYQSQFFSKNNFEKDFYSHRMMKG